MYPLRWGHDYTLLSAVSLRETDTLVVAAPVSFTVRRPFLRGETIATAPNAKQPSTVPKAPWAGWEQYERFSGKSFEGLVLRSHYASSRKLEVALDNTGSEEIHVKKWKGDCGIQMLVRDAFGKSIPMTVKGAQFFHSGTLLETHDLKPGDRMGAALPLLELFELNNAGEYTVLASLPIIGDVDAVLTAAPLKVRIEPEGREKGH
jgi:hypothetical protein